MFSLNSLSPWPPILKNLNFSTWKQNFTNKKCKNTPNFLDHFCTQDPESVHPEPARPEILLTKHDNQNRNFWLLLIVPEAVTALFNFL
jgi:hypothetical protein